MTQAQTVQIRAARAEDDALIKQMIRDARLDPSKLLWQNFVIAEVNGNVAGIGQVRHHADGIRELGSLVTKRAYQGQGIAGQIVAALEAKYDKPMYLFCQDKMATFYQRFGYRRIQGSEIPAAVRGKIRLTMLLRLFGIHVIMMRKD